jgi:hypothetical protein
MGSPQKTNLPKHSPRNFFLLVLYQVTQRVGWIFKTESIIIPAFMDYIGGGAVIRGCLPVLNRLGLAIAPVLFARRLKITPLKKRVLLVCCLSKAFPFALLSLIWLTGIWQSEQGTAAVWVLWLSLLLYASFFTFVGISQVTEQTLQGKLIRANLRGRLLTVSMALGASLAIIAVLLLMPGWLRLPDGGFGWIFGMPALAFLLAGVAVLALRESPDNYQQPPTHLFNHFRESWSILVTDHSFRRLAVVSALYSAAFMMFPHYQAMGRDRLGLTHHNLVFWVCAQNGATMLASLIAGPLADRYGNRIALKVAVFGTALAPLCAFLMAWLESEMTQQLYWLVFLPIGMTPITIKLINNYTLEIVPSELHPRYLSTVGLCVAMPVVIGGPLMGWLIRPVGFEIIFLLGAACLLLAGAMTFRLDEPRHSTIESGGFDPPRWIE